jgi:peptidoglycan/LPS O-acetylase OafA/YrhL
MTVPQPHLSSLKYRPDIDGLRAIAVLAVVGFHAFPGQIRGGFIGVDIFFVISGYLISIIIFENLDKGTFSFPEFYARRIKRIFPALLLTLIACFAFGWFALLADEYKQLSKHIAAGAGFISNVILWNEAGYFDNSAVTKPLLHLWSLGIEEQFYIVWPLVLWSAWKLKFNLLTITIVVAIASFILNIKGVQQDMVATFYSPQTRFWELLSGSLFAWVTLYKKGIFTNVKHKLDCWCLNSFFSAKQESDCKALANVLSLIGLLLLVYGFWRINKESSFPGVWGLVPVLGAVLIITASSKAWFNRVILSNKVAVWFGLISFPLYLWHWPILSFAHIIESNVPSLNIRIAAVILSIILAWLTHKLVERPIRFGEHGKAKVTMLVALAATLIVASLYVFFSKGAPLRYPKLEENFKQFTWSDFYNHSAECVKKYGVVFSQYCLISNIDQDPEVIILGDSNANHLFAGIKDAFPNKNVLSIGQGGCLPFLGLSVKLVEGELHCQINLKSALDLISTKSSVKTVIVSMMGAAYINSKREINGGLLEVHSVDIENNSDSISLFKEGMRKTIQFLQNNNKSVIFVVSTPRLNFDPSSCVKVRPFLFFERPLKNPCAMPKEIYMLDNKAYRDVVFDVLKSFPEVKIFDTMPYFCDQKFCNAIINDEVMFRDTVHLSHLGSKYLGRILRDHDSIYGIGR